MSTSVDLFASRVGVGWLLVSCRTVLGGPRWVCVHARIVGGGGGEAILFCAHHGEKIGGRENE